MNKPWKYAMSTQLNFWAISTKFFFPEMPVYLTSCPCKLVPSIAKSIWIWSILINIQTCLSVFKGFLKNQSFFHVWEISELFSDVSDVTSRYNRYNWLLSNQEGSGGRSAITTKMIPKVGAMQRSFLKMFSIKSISILPKKYM